MKKENLKEVADSTVNKTKDS